MGNNSSELQKKIPFNQKLNEKIADLISVNKTEEEVKKFKQTYKKKMKNSKYNINFSKLIKNKERMIDLSQTIITKIFDSNINKEKYKNEIHSNFHNSIFLYNLVEENSIDKEDFIKSKILDLNSLFINKNKFREDLTLTKSIDSFIFDSENKLTKTSTNIDDDKKTKYQEFIHSLVEYRRQSVKNENLQEITENLKNKQYTRNENSKEVAENEIVHNSYTYTNKSQNNIFPSPNNLESKNNFYTQSGSKLETKYINENSEDTDLKEIDGNINNRRTNNTEKTAKFVLNKTDILNKSENQIKSNSKTKKRIYVKSPVVNIKINLKDFIRQDAIEKSFLKSPIENKSTKNMKTKDFMNISTISKDHSVTNLNVNDASFVNMVDILTETKPYYREVLNKKNASKSPVKKNDPFTKSNNNIF